MATPQQHIGEFGEAHMKNLERLAVRSFPNNTAVYSKWARCLWAAIKRSARQPESPGDFPGASELSAYMRNSARPIPRPRRRANENRDQYNARLANTPWGHNKAVESHPAKLSVARALKALMAAQSVAEACQERASNRNDDVHLEHWGDPVDWENRGERIMNLPEQGNLELLYYSVHEKDASVYAQLLHEFGDDVFEEEEDDAEM